jgi:hypothetical protein
MKRILNVNFIIALFTGCALIAFAFCQRYGISGIPSETALFCAAAGICLLPVFYGLLRHKTCRN